MKVLLVLLLLVAVAAASTWEYGVTANPTINWINLVNDSQAVNITSLMGDDNNVQLNHTIEFDFSFYGNAIPSDAFWLDSNGYLSFAALTQTQYSPACPLPQDPSNNGAGNLTFMFYWTDFNFQDTHPSQALYRFFPVGSCPFPGKTSEGCLVIQFYQAYSYDDDAIANINAIVFTSGVMLSQVQLLSPFWGVPSEKLGALFGIQSWPQNASASYPNASCAWSGNTPYVNQSFVPQGGSFSFAFYPPCGVIGNLTGPLRSDGLGCGCEPGFYASNINCLACASDQISDGLTCTTCGAGLVPSSNSTVCVQSNPASGLRIPSFSLPFLLFFAGLMVLFL